MTNRVQKRFSLETRVQRSGYFVQPHVAVRRDQFGNAIQILSNLCCGEWRLKRPEMALTLLIMPGLQSTDWPRENTKGAKGSGLGNRRDKSFLPSGFSFVPFVIFRGQLVRNCRERTQRTQKVQHSEIDGIKVSCLLDFLLCPL